MNSIIFLFISQIFTLKWIKLFYFTNLLRSDYIILTYFYMYNFYLYFKILIAFIIFVFKLYLCFVFICIIIEKYLSIFILKYGNVKHKIIRLTIFLKINSSLRFLIVLILFKKFFKFNSLLKIILIFHFFFKKIKWQHLLFI